MNIARLVKAQVGRVNIREVYGLLLMGFAVPAIFYFYFDWRAAFAIGVIMHIGLVIISLRERA